MGDQEELLRRIEAFDPRTSPRRAEGEEWLDLADLVEQLGELDLDPGAAPVLLRVFERFPRHDGYGVMWSVLHCVEAVPGYERELVESLRRQPTEMTVTLLKRAIRAGVHGIGGVDARELLERSEPRAPEVDGTV